MDRYAKGEVVEVTFPDGVTTATIADHCLRPALDREARVFIEVHGRVRTVPWACVRRTLKEDQ